MKRSIQSVTYDVIWEEPRVDGFGWRRREARGLSQAEEARLVDEILAEGGRVVNIIQVGKVKEGREGRGRSLFGGKER